ncbi:MAG: hypothetical protein GF414_07470 [Candidatus Altiarchaeales archaeon]|nr:hypothetical protein [Candidatus Altiarchaeales archaeon]
MKVSSDKAKEIILSGKAPKGLHVGGDLYLRGCTSLKSLPSGLHVGGWLYLGGCTSLKSLPYSIHVGHKIYCDPELIENLPYEDLPLYMGLEWDNQKVFDKRLEEAL